MITRTGLVATLLTILVSSPMAAQYRTYAGSSSSEWKTVGKHGHDQPPCAEPRITRFGQGWFGAAPNCNPVDFARGNLDNSKIGRASCRERVEIAGGAGSLENK